MWRVWLRREGRKGLGGETGWREPLGRPRRRWTDIRMDLQEVECGYMDWIRLAQDRDGWRRLVSAVMNLRVPQNAGNFLTSCKPVSCSRRTPHHGVVIRQVDNQQFCHMWSYWNHHTLNYHSKSHGGYEETWFSPPWHYATRSKLSEKHHSLALKSQMPSGYWD